ncbi:hypothetical protein G6F42_025989 [Rhizopus arrhizus]|nr:hypothetical protein G6F42_025989 [Rhizopus arrhizus]
MLNRLFLSKNKHLKGASALTYHKYLTFGQCKIRHFTASKYALAAKDQHPNNVPKGFESFFNNTRKKWDNASSFQSNQFKQDKGNDGKPPNKNNGYAALGPVLAVSIFLWTLLGISNSKGSFREVTFQDFKTNLLEKGLVKEVNRTQMPFSISALDLWINLNVRWRAVKTN